VTNWQLTRRIYTKAAESAGEFSRLKWLAAALGSAATAYILGGVVLSLRLEQANFPIQDGLNAIPRSTMLVTGVRELVITAFVGLVLLFVVLGWGAFARWAFSLKEEIGIGIVIGLLLLVGPLNAAGLAWPVAMSVLACGAYLAKRRAAKEPNWAPSLMVTAILVLGAVAAITLARYTSPPYQFALAEVQMQADEETGKRESTFWGGYLGGDSQYVYLAYRDNPENPGRDESIGAYARDDVLWMMLHPPPSPENGPTSLLEEIFGVDFSITPQGDIWSDGNYEGWRLFR